MSESVYPFFQASVTTTTDTSEGLLLRLHKDEADNYVVSDLVGLRFGYAPSVYAALTEWWAQVSDLLSMRDDQMADPARSETQAYRKALAIPPLPLPTKEDA